MKESNHPKQEFIFGKINYTILLVGLAVVAVGFLLMSGGGTTDPNEFSDAIFDFRRIRLAPTVVLAGFVVIVYGILKNPKK
jgi:hypothetical protein